jgi:tetratricopeptide (TPR) repeat protein
MSRVFLAEETRLCRVDSALALYEQGFSTPSLWRFNLDSYELAPALKRAGELYQRTGNRQRAVERYSRFVELWKNADAELQPGVREIRERLTRLAKEPAA